VGRGLPRADDAADRFAFVRGLRLGVNHKQQSRPDKPDGVPAITVRMQVGLRGILRAMGLMGPGSAEQREERCTASGTRGLAKAVIPAPDFHMR
jgi:hypothetical protein